MRLATPLHSESGQLNTGIVWGVIVMLVSISIGGLIFSKVQSQLSQQATENSIADNIATEVNDGATTVFPLLVLMVIVSVFVGMIGILKYMGG